MYLEKYSVSSLNRFIKIKKVSKSDFKVFRLLKETNKYQNFPFKFLKLLKNMS